MSPRVPTWEGQMMLSWGRGRLAWCLLLVGGMIVAGMYLFPILVDLNLLQTRANHPPGTRRRSHPPSDAADRQRPARSCPSQRRGGSLAGCRRQPGPWCRQRSCSWIGEPARRAPLPVPGDGTQPPSIRTRRAQKQNSLTSFLSEQFDFQLDRRSVLNERGELGSTGDAVQVA